MASRNDSAPAQKDFPELLPADVFLDEINELVAELRENIRCRRRRIARVRREIADRRA